MKLNLSRSILLASACIVTANAAAENREDAWVISAMGGIYAFDEDRGIAFVGDEPKNGPTGTLAVGYNFTDAFGIEGAVTFFTIEPENGNGDFDGQQYRLDALYHFNTKAKFVPYLVGGIGHQVINGTNWGDASEGLFNAGFGAKLFLSENVAVRADARAVNATDYDYSEAMYNIGISYLVGGKPNKPADADNDGVPDTADKCANTQPGIQVDAEGCALDTDKDGVANQNDSCPDTVAGTTVNEKGCPVDSDNDGITDIIDKCPNTPVGAMVNAAGCPVDTGKDVRVVSSETMYDGFYAVKKIQLQHKRYEGGETPVLSREMVVRRAAAGILLFDPELDKVVLIRQFRVGALSDEHSPWLLEIVAGLIETGEDKVELVKRESKEEANLAVHNIQEILTYYPSPGGSIWHAEMVALTLAQTKLKTFDLGSDHDRQFALYTSVEPCAMCFGAIPWSGVVQVFSGASDQDARAIGFDEGPKVEDWSAALKARNINVATNILRDQAAAVLNDYAQQGGQIYNGRSDQ